MKSFFTEWLSNQFSAVSLRQLDPTRESRVWRLSKPQRTRFKRIGPAKRSDRTGIARVDPLRLITREHDEFRFEVQFADFIEKCFAVLFVSKETLQGFG